MPIFYIRRLTGKDRSETANRHLAMYLAFVAGSVNAGGFLAIRQYTSHMSGIVAAMTDNLALGNFSLVLNGLVAVTSFLCGAIATTLCVRWARARTLEGAYAFPLLIESILLAIFGLTGHVFAGGRVLGTIGLLCFTMGLQNALITKLSNAVIRTTHVTGIITDIGIALGRVAYEHTLGTGDAFGSELDKLKLLSSLIAMFFGGGIAGALGFKRVGFLFALPLAAALFVMAVIPLLEDLRNLRKVEI